MAMGSGSTMRVVGIILIVIGVGLAFWGYQLSGSVGSQISQTVTGADTDEVMIFYITSAVSLVVGLFFFVKN